jgi:hypothetical protein
LRLLVTGVAYGGLRGARRPAQPRSIWLVSLIWIVAIALLAGIAVAR